MLYPLKFEPLLIERVWGGSALARFGKHLPPGKPIGESWEISNRDGARTEVLNGPLKRKTIRQVIEILGPDFLGTNCPDWHYFPLLIKLLDARERLSLQVHPPANIAGQLRGEPKTEMWYVLEADPGAHLIAGLKRGATREQFEQALTTNNPPLTNLVHRFPVFAGDSFFVPSGRLHAIDAGVVIIEVQQSSDTTYRVFDWNRVGLDGKPRQLHIPESMASIDFNDFESGKTQPLAESREGNGLWRLVECEHFYVHKLALTNTWSDRCDGTTFHIIAGVTGKVGILAGNSEEHVQPGEFVMLPAGLGHYTLTPMTDSAQALKVFVPRRTT